MKKLFLSFILLISYTLPCFAQKTGFTQEDRERLVRLETTLKVFMEQVDKRFAELREDMNKRSEQVDKRFEQVDKRFAELREDMNKRFEQIDKRFEQVDKRFAELREDMNKRFTQMMNFLWMLVAIFTTLTGVVIGFAYWDRRTIIRKARDEAVEIIEKEGRLRDLIRALRALSEEDKKLANVLRNFGLL